MEEEIIILDDQGQERVVSATAGHEPKPQVGSTKPASVGAGLKSVPTNTRPTPTPTPVPASTPTADSADFPIGPRDKSSKTDSDPADFVLFPDDEEDAKNEADFVKQNKSAQLNVAQVVDKLKSQSGVKLNDPVLDNRFSNILFSHLRGVRESLETKETLQRSQKVGGLELEDNQTQKIMSLLEVAFDKLHSDAVATQPAVPITPQKEPKHTDDLNQTWQSPPQDLLDQFRRQKKTIADTAPPSPAASPVPPPEPPTPPKDSPPAPTRVKPQPQPPAAAPAPPAKPEPSPARVPTDIEKMKQDVLQELSKESAPAKKGLFQRKAKSKLTGPIQELHEFTLIEFRRLAPNPNDAISAIKEKIEVLGQESFSDKLKGIKAWQQSPVNQLYLQIGQASISQKQPITDIIKSREASSEETLSEAEFKAIMDLNMTLRHH